MVDLQEHYQGVLAGQRKRYFVVTGVLLAAFISIAAVKHAYEAMALGCLLIIAGAIAFYSRKTEKYQARLRLLESDIPPEWHLLLVDHSTYYNRLNEDDQRLFRMRVLFFLSDVRIEGVETEIDDGIKLMVASAAIIPTFAFPYFEYPNLRNVLIYLEAFNEDFETDDDGEDDDHSAGMVGTGFMNYSVLLSRRDLAAGFSGARSSRNVAIHEFVHLLDKADGSTDGVPAIFLDPASIPSWLELIDGEMRQIERGRSDIDPYALTDRAEFFAVVCEYFFNSPDRFSLNHPELHEHLCAIFRQNPGSGGYSVS